MSLNIFISWSKSRSYKVAKALHRWLRALFQEVRPQMSDDVEGGPMLPKLNDMLRRADILVLCITSDNWKEPWIFYEVGMAFGKSEDKAKVLPYIIDLHGKRRKLPEPLKQFRAYMANEEGTYDLVREINKTLSHPLSELELKMAFDAKWPELKKVIDDTQPTGRPDPQLCTKDGRMVTKATEDHQRQLKSSLSECIYVAIKDAKAGTYDREKIVEMAWKAIEESKERFRGKKSILVGNVADFFGAGFGKSRLREIIEAMETELSSRDLDQAARKLAKRLEDELEDAFKSFNSTLTERLKECLGIS